EGAVATVDEVNDETSGVEIGLPVSPSLGTLPWLPRERVFKFLNTVDNLGNMAKVPRFMAPVIDFAMRKREWSVQELMLWKDKAGLGVVIYLYPANVCIYKNTNLDWSRFVLSMDSRRRPVMRTIIDGMDDPKVSQLAGLFVYINSAVCGGWGNGEGLTHEQLAIAASLLGNAAIDDVEIHPEALNDASSNLILSIVARTKKVTIFTSEVPPLSNAATFVRHLDRLP
ncbi:hypothetical protein PMAYCL1PPCAC_28150, partial [Pristionchus mayeri]